MDRASMLPIIPGIIPLLVAPIEKILLTGAPEMEV